MYTGKVPWFQWVQHTALMLNAGLGLFKKIFSISSKRLCTCRKENPVSFTHINDSTQEKQWCSLPFHC